MTRTTIRGRLSGANVTRRTRTLLPTMFARDLNRQIYRASKVLMTIANMCDDRLDALDVADANATQLAACDDLESLRDEAEDADRVLDHLYTFTQKLQRYTRITRKGGAR